MMVKASIYEESLKNIFKNQKRFFEYNDFKYYFLDRVCYNRFYREDELPSSIFISNKDVDMFSMYYNEGESLNSVSFLSLKSYMYYQYLIFLFDFYKNYEKNSFPTLKEKGGVFKKFDQIFHMLCYQSFDEYGESIDDNFYMKFYTGYYTGKNTSLLVNFFKKDNKAAHKEEIALSLLTEIQMFIDNLYEKIVRSGIIDKSYFLVNRPKSVYAINDSCLKENQTSIIFMDMNLAFNNDLNISSIYNDFEFNDKDILALVEAAISEDFGRKTNVFDFLVKKIDS